MVETKCTHCNTPFVWEKVENGYLTHCKKCKCVFRVVLCNYDSTCFAKTHPSVKKT
jgi:hypothetical protein